MKSFSPVYIYVTYITGFFLHKKKIIYQKLQQKKKKVHIFCQLQMSITAQNFANP